MLTDEALGGDVVVGEAVVLSGIGRFGVLNDEGFAGFGDGGVLKEVAIFVVLDDGFWDGMGRGTAYGDGVLGGDDDDLVAAIGELLQSGLAKASGV